MSRRGFRALLSYGVSDWIDISVPVRNGMVHWPGDPPFHIERAEDQDKGDVATVSRMTLGVHTELTWTRRCTHSERAQH